MSTGLHLDAVTKRRSAAFQLGPVSLFAASGSCLGLVGANGSGKSTLLRCLLGTVAPDSGTLAWNGTAVRPNVPTPGVAGLIEEPGLFPRLDAVQNLRVAFPSRILSRTECRAVLERVGLGAAGSRIVGRYSQGMRQRLGLARVLIADASLIVLDEPTNGLDPVGIKWLRSLIAELQAEGRTLVVSSHLLHEIQQVADSFVMLTDGRVFAQGPVASLPAGATLEDLYFSVVESRQP